MNASPVRISPVLVGAMLLAVGGLLLPQGKGQANPEMGAKVRGARTVRLEVRQSYDFSESEEPGDATAKKDFLPLRPLASEIVDLAGWQVATTGAGDLTLRIEVTGDALGAEYTGTLSGFHYSGASLSGTVTLLRDGETVSEEALDASISPPHMITASLTSRRSAPFATLLPDYCAAVWSAIGRALGPAPLVAALPRATGDGREGMLEALIVVSDQSTAPAFRAMLREQDPVMVRLGALGLGVVGDGSEMPAMLGALRALKEEAPAEGQLEWWLKANKDGLGYGEARDVARGLVRHGSASPRDAILWGLEQLNPPEKAATLVAAARGRDPAPFRASVVLLLGDLDDPAARDQITAALGDADRLVRAAAVTALGDRAEDALLEPLLRLAADDDADLRQIARGKLERLADAAWGTWIAQRGGNTYNPDRATFEAAFGHSDPLIRYAALQQATIEEEDIHLDLIARLVRQDTWTALRGAAVEATKNNTSPETVETMVAALRDPVPFVRDIAAEVLAGNSDTWGQSAPSPLPESVVEPALALARQGPAERADRGVRILGRVGGSAATQALEQLAREASEESVRRRAVLVLVKTRPSSSAPVLLELARKAKGDAMDMEVGLGLGELGHPATLEPLIALLKSGSPASRRVAGLALGRMKLMRAAGPLIAALQAADSGALVRDEEFVGILRTSLQELTGRWFTDAEEARRWWRENSAHLTAR